MLIFKIKKIKKHDMTVICGTCKKSIIPYDPKLLKEVLDKYIELLSTEEQKVIILDFRILEKFSMKLLWEEGVKYSDKIDKLCREKVKCISLISTVSVIKNALNSFNAVYPAAVPFKICSSNDEAMKFIMSTLDK